MADKLKYRDFRMNSKNNLHKVTLNLDEFVKKDEEKEETTFGEGEEDVNRMVIVGEPVVLKGRSRE